MVSVVAVVAVVVVVEWMQARSARKEQSKMGIDISRRLLGFGAYGAV